MCRYTNAHRDPKETKRPVTSIAWHPEGSDRMVVAHCVVNFQHHTPDTSLDCYVYRTGSFVSTLRAHPHHSAGGSRRRNIRAASRRLPRQSRPGRSN